MKQKSSLIGGIIAKVLLITLGFIGLVSFSGCSILGEEDEPEIITASYSPVNLGKNVTMDLVKLSTNTFIMGSETGEIDEKPTRAVTLTHTILISTTEVTQRQYETITSKNPSYFKHADSGNQPVEQVSWFDAIMFCNSLSIQQGLSAVYVNQNASQTIQNGDTVTIVEDANGYRLLTEAEWEWAARAGTTTKYSYGEDFDSTFAWGATIPVISSLPRSYSPTFSDGTKNVATKKANQFGLYDMYGNVWEWVWDWHASYNGQELTDPAGPSTGNAKVLRGGSWNHQAAYLTSSRRAKQSPSKSDNDKHGFRIARYIK